MTSEKDDGDSLIGQSETKFNFASYAAGAVILDKSPSSAKGFSNLLDDDKDRYGISPCSEKKWVVIGLSEDILVSSIVIANYEKYSSLLKDFQLLASTSFPTEDWLDLGQYQAEPVLGEQTFLVPHTQYTPHTRYLKFKFLTHYGSEDLCTLSQIKVHGTTVIASFQQEVKRSDNLVKDMLNQLRNDESVLAVSDTEVSESSNDTDSVPDDDVDGVGLEQQASLSTQNVPDGNLPDSERSSDATSKSAVDSAPVPLHTDTLSVDGSGDDSRPDNAPDSSRNDDNSSSTSNHATGSANAESNNIDSNSTLSSSSNSNHQMETSSASGTSDGNLDDGSAHSSTIGDSSPSSELVNNTEAQSCNAGTECNAIDSGLDNIASIEVGANLVGTVETNALDDEIGTSKDTSLVLEGQREKFSSVATETGTPSTNAQSREAASESTHETVVKSESESAILDPSETKLSANPDDTSHKGSQHAASSTTELPSESIALPENEAASINSDGDGTSVSGNSSETSSSSSTVNKVSKAIAIVPHDQPGLKSLGSLLFSAVQKLSKARVIAETPLKSLLPPSPTGKRTLMPLLPKSTRFLTQPLSASTSSSSSSDSSTSSEESTEMNVENDSSVGIAQTSIEDSDVEVLQSDTLQSAPTNSSDTMPAPLHDLSPSMVSINVEGTAERDLSTSSLHSDDLSSDRVNATIDSSTSPNTNSSSQILPLVPADTDAAVDGSEVTLGPDLTIQSSNSSHSSDELLPSDAQDTIVSADSTVESTTLTPANVTENNTLSSTQQVDVDSTTTAQAISSPVPSSAPVSAVPDSVSSSSIPTNGAGSGYVPLQPNKKLPPCLEALKFQEFKSKMEAKLSLTNREGRDASFGESTQHNENVFTQLMQKFKSLEMNHAIYELYAIQMSECHQLILRDLWAQKRVTLTVDKMSQIEAVIETMQQQQEYMSQLTLAMQLSSPGHHSSYLSSLQSGASTYIHSRSKPTVITVPSSFHATDRNLDGSDGARGGYRQDAESILASESSADGPDIAALSLDSLYHTYPGFGLRCFDDCKIFSSNPLALRDCYENVYRSICRNDQFPLLFRGTKDRLSSGQIRDLANSCSGGEASSSGPDTGTAVNTDNNKSADPSSAEELKGASHRMNKLFESQKRTLTDYLESRSGSGLFHFLQLDRFPQVQEGDLLLLTLCSMLVSLISLGVAVYVLLRSSRNESARSSRRGTH